MSGGGGAGGGGGWGARAGALVIVALALVRAGVAIDPVPYWSMDPLVVASPMTGFGPAQTLALDVLSVLVAAGVLWLSGAAARWWAVAALIGVAFVAYHALVASGRTIEDVRIGGAWTGAVVGAVAVFAACRGDAALRRWCVAAVAGFVMVLACKGALQVLVEHPRTVAEYRGSREAFLAAQGWSEGSAAARQFERRLEQAEASGWFGLANVYASFAAVSAVMLAGVLLLAVRARRGGVTIAGGVIAVIAAGAACGAAALVMAGGKGGFAAAALGAALLAAAVVIGGRVTERWARLIGPAVIAAALGAVVVRGIIGERLGELSILFRWFYMQGAVAVFAESPLAGVGPAGFKDAYTRLKPAISPEEVASPHSVLLDLGSMLGLGGLAWCAVFVGLCVLAGRALVRPEANAAAEEVHGEPAGGVPAIDARLALVMVAVPVVVSAMVEREMATPDAAVARVLGLVLGVAVAAVLPTVMRAIGVRAWSAVAAGALALAAHAQIEVTPVWGGSAALAWVVLALAASAAGPTIRTSAPRLVDRAPAVVLVVCAVVGGWMLVRPALQWQAMLAAARNDVAPIPELRVRLDALRAGAAGADSLEAIARDVGMLLARPEPVPATAQGVVGALNELTLERIDAAAERLKDWVRVGPRPSPETAEAFTNLRLRAWTLRSASGEGGAAVRDIDAAVKSAEMLVGITPNRSASYVHLAMVLQRRGVENDLSQAQGVLERAAALAPYSVDVARRLSELAVQRGDQAEAARWARKALELDEQLRLDPLRRLPESERRRLEAAAQGR